MPVGPVFSAGEGLLVLVYLIVYLFFSLLEGEKRGGEQDQSVVKGESWRAV